MRPEDLLHWIRATSFVPFRIRLNSGRTFEIRHPEMMRVGRSTVHIFSYSGGTDDPYEKVEMVSLIVMESIEPIETPRAA